MDVNEIAERVRRAQMANQPGLARRILEELEPRTRGKVYSRLHEIWVANKPNQTEDNH